MGVEVGQNWHERLPLDLICHIRRGNIDDLARLARLSIGQAVGLVLSSGGARGFAIASLAARPYRGRRYLNPSHQLRNQFQDK